MFFLEVKKILNVKFLQKREVCICNLFFVFNVFVYVDSDVNGY